MHKMKSAVAAAAVMTSTALVLPALAQDEGDTTSVPATNAEDQDTPMDTGTSAAATEGELDATATGADVDAETAEDDGGAAGGTTGTGGTIPNELPDTGGGWGARLR